MFLAFVARLGCKSLWWNYDGQTKWCLLSRNAQTTGMQPFP